MRWRSPMAHAVNGAQICHYLCVLVECVQCEVEVPLGPLLAWPGCSMSDIVCTCAGCTSDEQGLRECSKRISMMRNQ